MYKIQGSHFKNRMGWEKAIPIVPQVKEVGRRLACLKRKLFLELGKKKKLYNLRKLCFLRECTEMQFISSWRKQEKPKFSLSSLSQCALRQQKRIFKHVKSNMRCKENTQWEEKTNKFKAFLFPSCFFTLMINL